MSLRTRLACALAAVALVLGLSGFAVLALVRESLTTDLDHQLSAATALAAGPANRPFPPFSAGATPPAAQPNFSSSPRFTELFVGQISRTGSLTTAITPDLGSSATPAVTLQVAESHLSTTASARPFNATSADGRHGFRVVAVRQSTGAIVVVALPTDRTDETYGRVRLGVFIVAATIIATVGLAGWWVQRLGLRPIRELTDAAAAIAEGDLGRRANPGATKTEVGQLASAFNTMIDKRQAADEQLRTFVADASHELRTPLATVAGALELHAAGALDDTQLNEALRRARNEAKRMTGLVNDLLDLADLDRGVPLTIGVVDLSQLATDAAFDASIIAPGRAITADIEPSVLVQGDESRLRQVVANLVSNALTHTPPESRIWLTVEREGPTCRLDIADDGPGLTDAQSAHVFDRFFRADPGRTRAHGGAGLGLSIAQAIAVAHHGTIWSCRRQPTGVTFSVRLPAAPTPPPTQQEARGKR